MYIYIYLYQFIAIAATIIIYLTDSKVREECS